MTYGFSLFISCIYFVIPTPKYFMCLYCIEIAPFLYWTFLKLYFTDYIITVVLIFPLLPSHQPAGSTNSGNDPNSCSCPWVMSITSLATLFPILSFTSPWPFCSYLFILLNPLPLQAFPFTPLPSGNHQNDLCIHDSISVLVCLVCFLDSIVGRFVSIAILLFIVLIFFSLNKYL